MKRKKENEYLALYWCKNMRKQLVSSFGVNIPAEELFSFVSAITRCPEQGSTSSALETMQEFSIKYPAFADIVDSIADMPDGKRSAYLWNELLKDFDSIANIMMWAENKQCFQFDADFTEELMKTDNLPLNKNAWNFLPFRSFYVDISADRKLCEEIAGEGIFVTVEKVRAEYEWDITENDSLQEEWIVHLCKVDRKYFFHDLMSFPNITMECEYSAQEKSQVEVHDIVYDSKNKVSGLDTRNITVNKKMYQVLVAQILNYLSSEEPDICENEQTKVTYKPKNIGNAEIKDKFSEIRKWDVGVRFGTAFRKWRLSEKTAPDLPDTEDADETTEKKQRKSYRVRPHSRKAHWSHYWYGSGDNKVRRPKWIAATFVNVGGKQQELSPVVIHKCS